MLDAVKQFQQATDMQRDQQQQQQVKTLDRNLTHFGMQADECY